MSIVKEPRVLKIEESYTFSKYFELPFRTKDILADFGFLFEKTSLILPNYDKDLEAVNFLKNYIQRNLKIVNSVTETAKREIIISPILVEACAEAKAYSDIEYPIYIDSYLKGTLDYYITGNNAFLVVEAKQSDLDRGFTQLAVELVALKKWIKSEVSIIYGAVTTGEDWRFGFLSAKENKIVADTKLYRIPEEIDSLLRIIIGILTLPS
ncbi:hypothetical protein NUACC21_08760 [Scytonema sp. NUACC21]